MLGNCKIYCYEVLYDFISLKRFSLGQRDDSFKTSTIFSHWKQSNSENYFVNVERNFMQLCSIGFAIYLLMRVGIFSELIGHVQMGWFYLMLMFYFIPTIHLTSCAVHVVFSADKNLDLTKLIDGNLSSFKFSRFTLITKQVTQIFQIFLFLSLKLDYSYLELLCWEIHI